MEFGIDKCATLVLKRRKITKIDGISLPDERFMKGLIEGEVINIWVYYNLIRFMTQR